MCLRVLFCVCACMFGAEEGCLPWSHRAVFTMRSDVKVDGEAYVCARALAPPPGKKERVEAPLQLAFPFVIGCYLEFM